MVLLVLLPLCNNVSAQTLNYYIVQEQFSLVVGTQASDFPIFDLREVYTTYPITERATIRKVKYKHLFKTRAKIYHGIYGQVRALKVFNGFWQKPDYQYVYDSVGRISQRVFNGYLMRKHYTRRDSFAYSTDTPNMVTLYKSDTDLYMNPIWLPSRKYQLEKLDERTHVLNVSQWWGDENWNYRYTDTFSFNDKGYLIHRTRTMSYHKNKVSHLEYSYTNNWLTAVKSYYTKADNSTKFELREEKFTYKKADDITWRKRKSNQNLFALKRKIRIFIR